MYQKKDKNVKIYSNGSIDYTYNKENESNKKEMKISDKECRKKAGKFCFQIIFWMIVVSIQI